MKLLLADEAFDNKSIVICWHHGKIVDLAARLLDSAESTDY